MTANTSTADSRLLLILVSDNQRYQRKETMIANSAAQKYRMLIASIMMLTVGVILQRSLASAGEQQSVIHQLRIYEIFDSNKKAFHDRFRDHAVRIMAKYDFKDSCHLGIEERQSN